MFVLQYPYVNSSFQAFYVPGPGPLRLWRITIRVLLILIWCNKSVFLFFQENTFQQIKQHQRGPEFWCYIETFIVAPGHTPPLFRLLSGFRGYTLCAEAVTRSQLKWRTAFQLQDTNLWTDGKLKLPQKQKINVCFASRVTDE